MRLPPTPEQTIGPFYHFALLDLAGPALVAADAPGAVRLAGMVVDGSGAPVDDALIETWQADADGNYPDAEDAPDGAGAANGFSGFGRCATDPQGRFSFTTVKPGRVPGPGGRLQAPHLLLGVFARGLLRRVVTRVYFPDEATANAQDPILSLVEDPAARERLVARPEDGELRFDIVLQGDGETPFFVV